jgi:precorrin-2/cobalt-factor-2 C20-methyltransferase
MRLVGVGVGPGDPDLVTVKAVRVMRDADLVLVPVMALDEPGRAEATVRAHVDHDRVRRVVFALNEREDAGRRAGAWDAAGRVVADAFAAGTDTVAFATIGDPNVYSTFTYLAQTVRELVPDLTVETVPGITAMQDLAARSGTVLCEGSETLALFPMTAGLPRFAEALEVFDTVVAYKGGRRMPEVLDVVKRAGRLDGAVFGAGLGPPAEQVRPAADLVDRADPAPYLSTLLVPAARTRRGGKL